MAPQEQLFVDIALHHWLRSYLTGKSAFMWVLAERLRNRVTTVKLGGSVEVS